MSHRGTLFVVTAPSGAGKTSLVHALVKRIKNLRISVSHTTRLRRSAEVDTESYYFMTVPEFQKMVEEGAFLEHAEVYGNHYGTSQAWVECTLASGQDVILEIDWQGAEAAQALLPDCVTLFILPPSLEALGDRLSARRQDDDAVIADRLAAAEADISRYKNFDFLVVNADFGQALNDMEAIVCSERLRRPCSEKKNEQLLAKLLKSE